LPLIKELLIDVNDDVQAQTISNYLFGVRNANPEKVKD